MEDTRIEIFPGTLSLLVFNGAHQTSSSLKKPNGSAPLSPSLAFSSQRKKSHELVADISLPAARIVPAPKV